MTSNVTLERCLRSDFKTRNIFGGVLPVDRLPLYRLRRKPRVYIVNTDDSRGPGEHWVLVYISAQMRGVYFDSYGLDVLDRRITEFLTKNCSSYIYNSRHLQGAMSQTCGQFCVYVARRLARGHSLRRILSNFRTFNTYYNDSLVVSSFRNNQILNVWTGFVYSVTLHFMSYDVVYFVVVEVLFMYYVF